MSLIGQVYVVSSSDNVATALDRVPAGQAQVFGCSDLGEIPVHTELRTGHKLALRDIAQGEHIIKYGAVIGVAVKEIRAGDWVHIHNIASLHDTRSASAIDPYTGKVMDTRYE